MSKTILIIDDSMSQLRMKEHALQQKLNYQTTNIPGGEEAVETGAGGERNPCLT